MPKNFILAFFIFFGINTGLIYGQNLKLKIDGHDENQTRIIDSIGYIDEFQNLMVLKAEIDSLFLKYESIGFYNSRLLNFKQTNDTIYNAQLDLGIRTKYIRIYFAHLEDANIIRKFWDNTEDDFIEIKSERVQDLMKTISERLSENGDPFIQLNLKNIKSKNGRLLAELQVKRKERRRIDNIIIKGYEKFPKSYVKNFAGLKKGNQFNLKRLKERSLTINNLIFANQTREPEILFTKDSTLIYMYIKKRQANSFDGFLGFGTNEDTGKLRFDGYLNLNLINNLNYGESFSLYYKSDESEQRTFNVDLETPYLLGSPFGIAARLNIFKRDSTFLNSEQNASLQYQFGSSNKISAGVEFKKSENLLDNQIATIRDFDATFLKIQYLKVKQVSNDKLFPVRYKLNTSYSIGKRNSNLGDTEQALIEWDFFSDFRLNRKNSIYGRISGGYIDSDNFLENEQFRFGGIRSIRGFAENSIIADLFGVLNTEYRYKLSSSLYVHSILDFAYYENQISKIEQNLFGFGFGFGVLTQAGLLKFNYAGQKFENQNVQLSDFKIHINLTASF